MTLDELKQACDESDAFAKHTGIESGVSLMIPGHRYGRTCRILSGITGENLGHYGDRTMVFVKTSKLRKFIQETEEEILGNVSLF